jgi:hypothetical protein
MQHFIRKGPPFGSSAEPDPRYVVDVTPAELNVTCGRFRLSTPRSNVASARRIAWTGKGGWRLQWTHVALIGSREGVVEVTFEEPVPHRVLRIFPVRWRRLVVSMADPDAFLADLRVPTG